MPHTRQVRTQLPVAGAAVALLALALACAALPTRAADTPPKPATKATVKIEASPPSLQVAATAAEKDDTAAQDSESKRGEHRIRIDTDDEFDMFTSQVRKTPWIIGLVFLVVGSIFLTPVILLVGIIWYKLRKTRLQNEAMLALAEKGVVPPAQAAEALATGASAASVAPQVYQRAVAMRKLVVWSDLRKGVILSAIGLGFLFYAVTANGEPSWVGMILLFVGAGYIALWWLEGRHLEQARATHADNGGGTGSSGG